jgi:16S rRNA (guanine527-N7)-methyltransferase
VFRQVVDDGLLRLGLELPASVHLALEQQARLLLAWNSAMNLSALRSPEQIARRHVLDSLAGLTIARRLGGTRLLDLGSGAGYPGLPLALALPATECALVDSVAKKVRFLAVASAAAASAVAAGGEPPPVFSTLAERAEDLAQEPEQRAHWQLITARAVGSLAEVAELCLPLLTPGGHLLVWKRDSGDGRLADEMAAARAVIDAAGGGRARVERLPALAELGLTGHVIIVVEKRRRTPDRFPRPPAERRRSVLR